MTSARPSTTTTTTTTTARPSQPTTTSAYQQHQTGYPQHFQPRPAFPSSQSQSNTHYDDKNGGYHHQYIFHNDERSNNNQATSYQLFSNQGVSSTTPTPPQVHQQVCIMIIRNKILFFKLSADSFFERHSYFDNEKFISIYTLSDFV